MKRKQIIFAIFLLFLSILTMGSRIYGDETEKRFKVELDYGLDGKAAYGKETWVGVTVYNYGADFEGRVQLYSSRPSEDKQIAYYEEVMIPEEGSKKVDFILPGLENHGSIWITIENTNGKILMQEERTVSISNTDIGIIGVLSDDLNSLNYLSGAMIYNKQGIQMEILYLKSQNIPEVRGALEALSVLVIGNFDTSQLSDGQYQVIKDWVEAGGCLILGTGAEYKKTLGIFEKDGYLTGKVGDVKKEIRDFQVYDSQGEPRTTEIHVLELTVEEGKKNEELDCQIVDKGRGKIYLFDFSFEALAGWKYNKEAAPYIFENILEEFDPYPSVRETLTAGYAWTIKNMITDSGIGKIPGITLYILILITYIILLPVLYFILKATDKRHYIWFAVPAAAMLFGILIYLMGTGTRRKEPFINYTTVLEMDGKGALETDFFVVTSPRNKQYNIEIDKERYVNVISDYAYYPYEYKFHPKKIDFELTRKEDRTEIYFRTVQAFSRTYLSTEKYIEDTGTVNLDVYFSIDGLSGTITNNTEFDLSNCGIITEQIVLPIGKLKKGESVEIDSLLLNTNFSYYSTSEALIPYQYADNSEEEQMDTIKRNVLDSLFDYGEQIYNTQVKFVGFADSFDPGFGEMTGLQAEGVSLVMAQSEMNYKEENGEFISDLWLYSEVLEGNFYSNGYLTTQSAVVEYTFYDFDTVDAILKMSEIYYNDVSIAFFNYRTKEFDTVLEYDDKVVDMEDYLNEEKRLKVRYLNNNNSYELYEDVEIPVLSAFVTRQAAE